MRGRPGKTSRQRRARRNLSRRDFLRCSAAGVLAPVLWGGCAGRQRGDALHAVIDAHIHADFSDEVLRRQAKELSGVDFSPAGLLREMASSRVSQAIAIGFETEVDELSRTVPNPMGVEEEAPPLRGSMRRVGGINPHRLGPEGLAAIERAIEARRLIGLKIYLGYYHLGPGDEVYRPVYELARKHRVPVIFHTGDTYSATAKVRYAHPLPVDDVAVDYPDVTFVLAHLGNPWTIDAAEVLYKNRNVYADLSGFLVGDERYFSDPENQEGIEHAIDRIRRAIAWVENPRKFLYGSDWPLVPMAPYIEFIRRAVDPRHHERVFYANAREVFGLE